MQFEAYYVYTWDPLQYLQLGDSIVRHWEVAEPAEPWQTTPRQWRHQTVFDLQVLQQRSVAYPQRELDQGRVRDEEDAKIWRHGGDQRVDVLRQGVEVGVAPRAGDAAGVGGECAWAVGWTEVVRGIGGEGDVVGGAWKSWGGE